MVGAYISLALFSLISYTEYNILIEEDFIDILLYKPVTRDNSYEEFPMVQMKQIDCEGDSTDCDKDVNDQYSVYLAISTNGLDAEANVFVDFMPCKDIDDYRFQPGG